MRQCLDTNTTSPRGGRGLALRVRASGHKSYVFFYRIEDHRKIRKIKIATADAVTLEMARELASEYWLVVNMGKDPAVWRFDHERARLERRKPTQSGNRQSAPDHKVRKAARHDLQNRPARLSQLRACGYSTSQAKRALRGEFPHVKTVETTDTAKCGEEYCAAPADFLVPDVYTENRLRILETPPSQEGLTEQAVAQAEPLGHEYSIRDGTVPGLALRIRASGHKSYVLWYRREEDKKTRKIKVATAGAVGPRNGSGPGTRASTCDQLG